MEKILFKPESGNIFAFSFMDDFTTIELAEEEYGIDISEFEFKDGFYCFSEKKPYKTKDLYEKFNIEILENTDNKK